MLSHGFLKNRVDKKSIKSTYKKCNIFLEGKKKEENYFYLNDESLFDEIKYLEEFFLKDVKSLLNTKIPVLKAIELHIQKAKCQKIPPHQDNFYHCIDPNMGLKILVPLQELKLENGGLIFLDCDINFSIQSHKPSRVKNFSSEIEEIQLKKIKKSTTSYEYHIGDVSFHFLNSLHYSMGNKTNKDSIFLVFRYQNPNAKINSAAQIRYNKCLEDHKRIINK